VKFRAARPFGSGWRAIRSTPERARSAAVSGVPASNRTIASEGAMRPRTALLIGD
jgi:hypothetical protein